MKKKKRAGIFLLCGVMVLCFLMTGCAGVKTASQVEEEKEKELAGKVSITIQCDAILDNIDDLKSSKKEFVPEDGVILPETEVSFYKDDTVFDVLRDTCADNDIQLESQYTPLYKSYYIKGINNLYEFDCGANSGWMYSVNDEFPNYGCSSYTPKDGDKIVWCYTCDLGSDVGGDMSETEE